MGCAEVPIALASLPANGQAGTVKRERGLPSMDEARKLVETFGASTAFDPLGGDVQDIAAVWVSEQGRFGSDVEGGVRLTWRQGDNHYGLLMPISRLLEQTGDLDSAAFYLRLAVDEPHAPTPDGSVLWFEDLP